MGCWHVYLPPASVLLVARKVICGFTFHVHGRPEVSVSRMEDFNVVFSAVQQLYGTTPAEVKALLEAQIDGLEVDGMEVADEDVEARKALWTQIVSTLKAAKEQRKKTGAVPNKGSPSSVTVPAAIDDDYEDESDYEDVEDVEDAGEPQRYDSLAVNQEMPPASNGKRSWDEMAMECSLVD